MKPPLLLNVIVIVCAMLATTAQGQAADPPGVYAVIIGIGDNDLEGLKPSVPAAVKFGNAVRKTYPAAKIWMLTDKELQPNDLDVDGKPLVWPANVDRSYKPHFSDLRRLMVEKVEPIPPRSLLIFYFAGHGIRHVVSSDAFRSDLYLLLSGPAQKNFWEDSIRIDEVLEHLERTRQTNLMVFLDCCSSGDQNIQATQIAADLERLGIRGFLLSATTRTLQAYSGRFTDELIKFWSDNAQPHCVTPVDLESALRRTLPLADNVPMLAKLWFGERIKRCFADLGSQSVFLSIRFPTGIQDILKVELAPNQYDYFDPSSETGDVYARQVARKKTTIIVRRLNDPNPNGPPLFSQELPLDQDFVDWEIKFPGQLVNKAIDAASRLKVATLADGYGINAAPQYFTAAQAYHAYNSGFDTSKLLVRASQLQPKNPKYQLAIAHGTPADLNTLLASRLPPETFIGDLESVGRYEAAANFSMQLLRVPALAAKHDFFSYKAALNYQAAGKPDFAKNVKERVASARPLNNDQRRILNTIVNHDPALIAPSVKIFPKDAAAWQSAKADLIDDAAIKRGKEGDKRLASEPR